MAGLEGLQFDEARRSEKPDAAPDRLEAKAKGKDRR
jgi:hypothetical protein